MNIFTGDVKPFDQLSEAEKQSGAWVPLSRDQIKRLEAGKTSREEVRRELLAPIHSESGLPIDAKPQAHRRAIERKRAELSEKERQLVREIVGDETQIPVLPRASIESVPEFVRSADELQPGEALELMGGVASVQR